MSDNVVLAATDISRSFGDVSVVTDCSVTVASGTVTAVVGPNGSGKTTLLRTLAGVLDPTDGTVTYAGPETERRIGYLPQQPQFRPGFTVRETLLFYTALIDTPAEPLKLLDRVGLADAADRPVKALSGGMNRLLGIAQATVGDPPLIVLDEPGSGLDPAVRRRTFEVIREQADDGTAVLCSSHDLSLVESFADQVLVLDGGEPVVYDAPAALKDEYDCDTLDGVFDTAVDTDGTVAVID